jgi:hypothetical protein
MYSLLRSGMILIQYSLRFGDYAHNCFRKERYGSIGLELAGAQDAINMVACLMARVSELSNVVQAESENFVMFFHWLATSRFLDYWGLFEDNIRILIKVMCIIIENGAEEFKASGNVAVDTLKVLHYIKNSLHRDALASFFAQSNTANLPLSHNETKTIFHSGSSSRESLLPSASANTSRTSLDEAVASTLEGDSNNQPSLSSAPLLPRYLIGQSSAVSASQSTASILSGQTLHFKASFREIVATLQEQMQHALGCLRQFQNCATSEQAVDLQLSTCDDEKVLMASTETDDGAVLVCCFDPDASTIIIVRIDGENNATATLSLHDAVDSQGQPFPVRTILSLQFYEQTSLICLLQAQDSAEYLVVVDLDLDNLAWASAPVEMQSRSASPLQLSRMRLISPAKQKTPTTSAVDQSARLAVSTRRQLASILTQDRRRVTVFDLAADEEEDVGDVDADEKMEQDGAGTQYILSHREE